MNAQITAHIERTSPSTMELTCSACQFACTLTTPDDIEAVAKELATAHLRRVHKVTYKLDTSIRLTLFGVPDKKEKKPS